METGPLCANNNFVCFSSKLELGPQTEKKKKIGFLQSWKNYHNFVCLFFQNQTEPSQVPIRRNHKSVGVVIQRYWSGSYFPYFNISILDHTLLVQGFFLFKSVANIRCGKCLLRIHMWCKIWNQRLSNGINLQKMSVLLFLILYMINNQY